jgi:hypothetical protein
MKTKEALETLEQFQAWRTDHSSSILTMPSPKETTFAIDAAIAIMRLLEKSEAEAMKKKRGRAAQ